MRPTILPSDLYQVYLGYDTFTGDSLSLGDNFRSRLIPKRVAVETIILL